MLLWRPASVFAIVALVFAALPERALAQTAPLATDLADARRALNEGRYADVERTLNGSAADDADRAALRARAAEATGRDQDAEALLRAAASRHPSSDAALELALLLARTGRKEEARRLLSPLLSLSDSPTQPDLVRAGRAAGALGQFREANALFRQAVGRASDDVAANIAWGELFLEKYNREEATRSFKAALSADPRSVDALLGLARATADDDFAAALAGVRRALEINPSSAPVHVLLASLLLDAGYTDPARESANRALSVNARSPDAYALLAAIAYLDGRTADFDQAIAKVLAIDKTHGDAYRVVAAQLAHHYRFDDAVVLARKAVALDPDNARARAELGMDLLRTGEEEEARTVLKQAFEADPYDVVTYNLLAVLDALDSFETVRDGDLIVRMDAREAGALREPVVALAHEALRTVSAKYGFAPKGPILIEIFPHHDDFAVRNLGIPGLLGALGACFGRVVTMDSPKARPPGTFEWGATLWHELTHVVTLQMSNQRVPRWLTEGISVYEEQRARPEWRRPMEEAFVHALSDGTVPPIRSIEGSFADPTTIGLAYYQAGLIVGYLIDTYGQAKFNALVRAFADGVDTPAAFGRALGANADDVDLGFRRSLDKTFGAYQRALAPVARAPLDKASVEELKKLAEQHPESYDVQLALGVALRKQGDAPAAAEALNRAASLFPGATGQDSPHALLADMATERGDQAAAISELEKQLAQEPVNVELARRIAGIMGQSDPLRARRIYERIVALDPFDSEAHGAVGKLALKSGDSAAAIRELRLALSSGATDVAATRCDLAEAYLAAGDPAQAKHETLAALERVPSYERAQALLLKLVGGDR